MLILTIEIDAPLEMAQGFKEALSYDLEKKYGCVKVTKIEEYLPVQTRITKAEWLERWGRG